MSYSCPGAFKVVKVVLKLPETLADPASKKIINMENPKKGNIPLLC